MTSLIEETKAALRQLGVRPQKRRGQNFMIDGEILGFIAESLGLVRGEPVVEIGPGLGFLTQELLRGGARVFAVEQDRGFAGYLRRRFSSQDVRVFLQDILTVDLKRDLKLSGPVKAVGNIPYHITSLILEWLINRRDLIPQAVLTTQWEAARRLAAAPDTKEWGALAIFVQVYAEVEILKKVERRSFYPAPRVDSAVVRLRLSGSPRFPISNEGKFFAVVRKAFQKRRKMLLNALADESSAPYAKASLSETLRKAGIQPARRPETLSIPEWALLADRLTG